DRPSGQFLRPLLRPASPDSGPSRLLSDSSSPGPCPLPLGVGSSMTLPHPVSRHPRLLLAPGSLQPDAAACLPQQSRSLIFPCVLRPSLPLNSGARRCECF